jgi:hypothetical protein
MARHRHPGHRLFGGGVGDLVGCHSLAWRAVLRRRLCVRAGALCAVHRAQADCRIAGRSCVDLGLPVLLRDQRCGARPPYALRQLVVDRVRVSRFERRRAAQRCRRPAAGDVRNRSHRFCVGLGLAKARPSRFAAYGAVDASRAQSLGNRLAAATPQGDIA